MEMKRLIALGTAVLLQIGFMKADAATDYTTYAGYATVTGGGNATPVTVTTASALLAAAKGSASSVIIIKGSIDQALITCESNKTFIGDGTTATLTNSSFLIKGVSNIIIRNITMHFPYMVSTSADHDLVHIQGSTSNIWIDHCEFYNMIGDCNGDGKIIEIGDVANSDMDYYDGTIDITKGASKVTVSWCYIHETYKTSLIGSSDDDLNDWQVCYHHNLFNNTHSRLPSIRGGTAASFNNYFLNIPTSGINCRMGATVYIEKNYFNGVGDGANDPKLGMNDGPIGGYYSKSIGMWNVVGNTYVNCLGSQPTTSTTTYKPAFSYSGILIPTAQVPDTVSKYAGIVGKTKKLSYRQATNIRNDQVNYRRASNNQKTGAMAVYNTLGIKVGNMQENGRSVAEGIYIFSGNNNALVTLTTHVGAAPLLKDFQ